MHLVQMLQKQIQEQQQTLVVLQQRMDAMEAQQCRSWAQYFFRDRVKHDTVPPTSSIMSTVDEEASAGVSETTEGSRDIQGHKVGFFSLERITELFYRWSEHSE